MMYLITMSNRAGELDRREVEKQADIKRALVEMIHQVAHLEAGDTFTVEGTSDVKHREQ
jgi:hypothetical protein